MHCTYRRRRPQIKSNFNSSLRERIRSVTGSLRFHSYACRKLNLGPHSSQTILLPFRTAKNPSAVVQPNQPSVQLFFLSKVHPHDLTSKNAHPGGAAPQRSNDCCEKTLPPPSLFPSSSLSEPPFSADFYAPITSVFPPPLLQSHRHGNHASCYRHPAAGLPNAEWEEEVEEGLLFRFFLLPQVFGCPNSPLASF